jgi:serine protease DegQ
VSMRDMNSETAQAFNLPDIAGTLVIGVLRNGPADRAGIQPGDILLGVNGKKLADSSAVLSYVAQLAPGAQAQISVMRKRNERKVNVTIAKRPPLQQEDATE